jgi:hypothetical protein
MYTLSLTGVTETEESGHEAGYSRNLWTDPDTQTGNRKNFPDRHFLEEIYPRRYILEET